MGYYTTFKLSTVDKYISEELEMEITEDLAKNYLKYNEDAKSFDDLLSESLKWYGHDKDMISISEKYPSVLFLLEGTGEDNGDVWKSYYKNGYCKLLRARMVFDDFDPISEFRDNTIDKILKKE